MTARGQTAISEPTDETLVARFIERRDAEAFASLVERHSALVMGVCQRTLSDPHDAEDAFQATFLVFAERAARIRRRGSVASWLYGAAFRVATRLRRRRIRQRTVPLEDAMLEASDPFEVVAARHLQCTADEELAGLPASVREPLVLHYVCGLSNAAIAERLGLSVTAVEGRLKRGRRRLRLRLARRGVALGLAGLAFGAARSASAAVSESLIEQTAAACLQSVSGAASTAAAAESGASQTAFHLAQQEMIAMTLAPFAKAGMTLALTVAAALTVFGVRQVMTPPASAAVRMVDADDGGAADDNDVQVIALAADAPEEAAAADPEAQPAATQADDNPFAGGAPSGGGPSGGTRMGMGGMGSGGFARGGMGMAAGGMPGMGMEGAASTPSRRADLNAGPSAAERRIDQALGLTLDQQIEFTQTPLSEAIHFLQDYVAERGAPVLIKFDERALTDAAVDTSAPISGTFSGISLESAFLAILQDYGLDYLVQNEMIVVTTSTAAEGILDTRVYPLGENVNALPEELVELIQQTISPTSWNEQGGPGSLATLNNALVVLAERRVHAEISRLMRQLDQIPEQGGFGGGGGGGSRGRATE